MRETLFRAKAKHNPKLWVYGDYLSTTTRNGEKKHYIKRVEDGLLTPVEIIPETLGQYTGLTDKNETKIFEGDIVKAQDDILGSPFCYGKTGKVVYEETSFFIEPQNVMESEYLFNECAVYEVIGNTTDSPELLGGAE